MSNFIINGVEVSEEQYNRIKNMRRLSDDEIDYSDISKISHEEFLRAFARKRAKLQKNNLQLAS